MNIYDLNKEELKKIRSEFFKTGVGLRVTIFGCLIPFGLVLCSGILMISEILSEMLNEPTGDFYILLIIFSINMIGSCIAMLLYEKMLKEYVEKKSNKK